jgi:hypothetical protein
MVLKLDISNSRYVPGKFRNVMLENEGEDQKVLQRVKEDIQ